MSYIPSYSPNPHAFSSLFLHSLAIRSLAFKLFLQEPYTYHSDKDPYWISIHPKHFHYNILCKNCRYLHIFCYIRPRFFGWLSKTLDPPYLTQLYLFPSIHPVLSSLVTPSFAWRIGWGSSLEADIIPHFSNSAYHCSSGTLSCLFIDFWHLPNFCI